MTRLWIPASLVLCLAGLPAPAGSIVDLSTEFDYFANSWAVIGLKDYPNGCRITPEWRLQLADGVEAVWLLGAEAAPMPRGVRRTLPRGLPLPESSVLVDGGIECNLTAFAAPLPGRPYDYRRRRVDDENFLVVAFARVANTTDKFRSALIALRLEKDGTPVELEPGPFRGCVRSPDEAAEMTLQEGALAATWGLGPYETGHAVFCLPHRALAADAEAADAVRKHNLGAAYYETLLFWARLLRLGSRSLVIPEEKARDTYTASLAYSFIGRDDTRLHAGEGFYDGFYLRDGAFQAWALELAGYLDEARPSVLDFLKYQKPNGQFESQGGELDGHGQALWTLVRHYELTRDEGYLRQVYPAIRRGMAWLERSLKREADDPDAAFAGVLPKSWADGEHLSGYDYHVVGYDFWNLRGAMCAALAAEALGESGDAERWNELAADYKAAILRLVEASGARDFPPSLELPGTDWGNLTGLHPTRLFRPFHPRVSATIADARRTFVEGTIRWCPETQRAIHPYMSTYLTNSHVIRGEQEKAVAGLYAMLLHTTSDHGFPEGVYYPSRTAWSNTLPHLWAAAQYCILLRNMLIREDGDELHLASAVPPHWLAPGKEVAFLRAPTTFGEAGFRIEAGREDLTALVRAPSGAGVRQIVLHTPPSIRILRARARSGRIRRVSDREIVLAPEDAYLEIAIERRRARTRNYRATVARYVKRQRRGPTRFRAILTWPLDEPVATDWCVTLDLRQAANVDPFTAPFGTLNPGKYLFTGLKTGRVEAGGVPFETIDPAKNDRRGFIVLEGRSTSADFPREVDIPAGVKGRRAFFLGQVTGWMGSDPGDPKTGSVAEYVLVYADGKKQVVPLVSQQTVDDWATPPTAALTQVGLQGDPWHLSLLAVRLRPERLDRIIFRDRGTPASPLLAAVTIERE